MPVQLTTEWITLLLKRTVYLGLISMYWALLQKEFWHPHDEPFLKLQVYSISHSAAKHWLADHLVSFGNMKRELFEIWLFLSYSWTVEILALLRVLGLPHCTKGVWLLNDTAQAGGHCELMVVF